jgi:hypothetical protein
MILTVLRMAQEDHNRWNAKITLQTLRELEQAFRVLEQFKGRRKVTVFGSARTPLNIRCTEWPVNSAPLWPAQT